MTRLDDKVIVGVQRRRHRGCIGGTGSGFGGKGSGGGFGKGGVGLGGFGFLGIASDISVIQSQRAGNV